MTQTDYYSILGIDKSATAPQIKEAYRSLAFKYHPDRNSDSDSAEKMKQINEAYAVLSHPDKRQEYDMFRTQYGSSAYGHFRQAHTEQDIFRGSDINAVFEEMAKSFGFRSFDDIFKEFYGNGYQRFEFKQPGAFGKGYVFFGKPGRRNSKGAASPNLGGMGKLSGYLFKKMTGVDLPQDGADAGDVLYLEPALATDGGSIPYHVRKRSKDLMVRIPPRTRDGQWIRLAGMGEEGKGGGKAGDLYLQVKIRKPFFEELISSLFGLFDWFKSLWKRPR